MPTIKTIKYMTEKEYLHYLIDNCKFDGIESFYERKNEKSVSIDLVDVNDNATGTYSYINENFEVEIEEPITEDTVLPELVTRTVKGHYGLWKKGSINSFKHITFNDVEAFYVPNDDLTMTLIWTKEKGLIE